MAKRVEFDSGPIRITARGEWVQNGEPLHPRAALLFAKSLQVNPGGEYAIHLGFQTVPIEIEDVAYFVTSLDVAFDSEGRVDEVRIVVSDGREEHLNPATLMQSDDNVLYCRVLRDEFAVPCRFPSGHYHSLALHMDMDGEAAYLALKGERYFIQPFERLPKAMA